MRSKLSDICDYVKEKVDVSDLDNSNYVSTENMVPNKGGVTTATTLPSLNQTQQYRENDVLVSNIRPYFKKIWFATKNGGCSNDVLVFRAKNGIAPRYLYYVLSSDVFFNYSMATSRGTKMPRGDKKAIMQYEVPNFEYNIQIKIVNILSIIDKRITINEEINKNLRDCSKQRSAPHKTVVINVPTGRRVVHLTHAIVPAANDRLQDTWDCAA